MLKFTKLEGCGNDFVVVDLRRAEAFKEPAVAAALCDRRFGIGADGLLAIETPSASAAAAGALARMRVINSDGSEAEMCGNGIRCVAKYLYERDPELRRPELPIETGAGILKCGVTIDVRRRVSHVQVAMGRPKTRRGEIPMNGSADEQVLEQPIRLGDRGFHLTAVSMGNPHAVVFIDSHEPLRALAEQYGPALERHELFPRKTNAEFARVHSPTELELVVWERGCGITLACGTGACATAVAACLTGRAQPGSELAVRLLGGTLFITVSPQFDGVLMRGPAEEVFEGELDVVALAKRRLPSPGAHP